MWCDSVAGDLAKAGRMSEQPRGQLAFAIRSSSSNRVGSANAFNMAVRRALVRRAIFRDSASGADAVFIREFALWLDAMVAHGDYGPVMSMKAELRFSIFPAEKSGRDGARWSASGQAD